MTEVEGGLPRWSSDAKQIYFFAGVGGIEQVWVLSIGSLKAIPLTALAGRRGSLGGLGLATDGQSIYFTWRENRSDIWVADIVEPRN